MQVINELFSKFLQFFSGWISGLQQFPLSLFVQFTLPATLQEESLFLFHQVLCT